jgi:hypothetical protein
MIMKDLTPDHDFSREVDCTFKGERYSVRDNGVLMRYPRIDGRPRPTDNHWTFGKLNSKNGYMFIASIRIHQIVATAFHGVPPTKEYIVDHIDTNKQNNRQENLRWLTRLENILLNPITEYAEQLRENEILFQNMSYGAIILKSATIEKEEVLLVLYEIIREENRDKRWGIMKITSEYEKFVHEIIPNYNNSLEHILANRC